MIQVALIQKWEDGVIEMQEIPVELFYRQILPFGWSLVGIFNK